MTPKTETELAEMIKAAKDPLRIQGGGTRPIGRPVEGEILSTAGLSGISLYEPGSLTLVAQAGTPLAEIEAVLAAEGQRLAFEPMDHRGLLGTTGAPTIGGVVAGNISGSRRIAVGACRDFLLGVRFVDGQGAVLKNGGRVMKNVTGYDLVKLLAGSWGTLGVLSEVSLKVLPLPETSATILLHDLSLADSVAAMSAALGSPFEVTGAARRAGDTYLRIEGFEASVAYRAGQLTALLARFCEAVVIDQAASVELWQEISNVADFTAKDVVSRVSVKPSDAPQVLEALQQQFEFDEAMDWGGGLLWIGAMSAQEDVHAAAQEAVSRIGGHATLVKAPAAVRARARVFQPENPVVAQLARGLRARFDPRGILNPGLMGGE